MEFRGLNLTDKYEYDANGNIIRRTTGGKEIRYTYDDIDRLIREDNAALNKTYFYEYDDFGNIEKVTSYNYTTGNSLTGGVTRTFTYDTNKRLISVTENGVTQSISGYDALGNPSSYKGKTLTWTRGRMLASYGSDSYLYDMDGVRQEKTVNGVTHIYYTDGTKIIAEKVGDKVFEYYYDAQGVIGFKYDGNVYYYKKNLLGDIDRIYDANKNLVAEYKYDAWGNHRIYSGAGLDITENATYNNSVAKVNPFRYRGYYYDTETGLFYLTSRYYDPETGRFINADDVSYINPEIINGLNLYAYCGNNPVMNKKSEGMQEIDLLYPEGFGGSNGRQSIHSVPDWLKTGIGAIPDIILGIKYLLAKGIHNKFVYSTNTLYMFPELGANWSRFKIAKNGYGKLVGASFKQIITGNARAGWGAVVKSFGKAAALTGIINFGFNLYENNWQIDGAMLLDTAIDTGIGLASYGLAALTASFVVAGVAMAGIAIPGVVVVGGIILLSIGFEWLIREITGYKN